MKELHNIVISVFSKEEDDAEKVKQALLSLIPLDLEKEKILLGEQTASGFGERKIKIFDIRLDKQRHIRKFMEHFLSKLSDEQKSLLIRQKESRLDEECDFFIRLDKEKLLEGGYFITDSGNCYHIKMSIAAFPAKREIAIEMIDKIFK